MISVKDDMSKVSGLSREARLYALKELARRAGVSADFFHSWTIDFQDQETIIHLPVGTDKRIHFKNASPQFWQDVMAGMFHTIRASWMHPPPEPLASLVCDFAVPFSCARQKKQCPLFLAVNEHCVKCPVDLPVSMLLTLSRFEEVRAKERDIHGRFKASTSVAFRDGFLHRPVVDEYGLALEQALTYLLPTWRPAKRTLRIKLSHDVDDVGVPFSFRSACRHTVLRHNPLATLRDVFGKALGLWPTHLDNIRRIVLLSLDRGLDSAVYWAAGPASPWDSGYDSVIHWCGK
jgi:hypothetical protein